MQSARLLVVTICILAIAPTPILAQAATNTQAAPAATTAPHPIGGADIKAWNTIRQTVLSPDGKRFAYVIGPVEGNLTMVLRSTAAGATESRIPVGENGGSMVITGDSRWLGYIVAPPRVDSSARGRGAGRGGPGAPNARGGGGGANDTQAADSTRRATANKFVLMNLASGEKTEFDRIRRFQFNADTATWIALVGYAPGQATTTAAAAAAGRAGGPVVGGAAAGAVGGASVILYSIETGERFNMGPVGEFAFDESGNWLAYTMETTDQVGNGVQLRNMKTSASRSLDSEQALYRHLAWTDSSRALGVMRGKMDDARRDTTFTLVAFTQFGASGPAKRLTFDPTGRQDFPKDWKIASDRAPRYATDLSAVFFGVREKPPAAPTSGRSGAAAIASGAPGAGGTINQAAGGRGGAANDDVSLILWHRDDPRLQSQQIVQEQADRSFNYLSQYRFGEDRFVRLVADSMRSVTITAGDKFAYGTDNRDYQQAASYSGRNFMDVYRIDLTTGKSSMLMKKKPAVGPMMASPDGRKVLYWGKDGHYWVLDLATGDTVNITRGVPTSFVNTEDDHNNLYPPSVQPRGWAKDNSSVLLYDNWDVWQVPVNPASARAVNLTGDGRRTQVRYNRTYTFDATAGGGGGGGGGGGRFGGPGGAIDLSKPLYFGTYGEWTKKEGLSRVDPGKPGAQRLVFDTARLNVIKARDADTFIYTRQNFTEFPDYHVFAAGFEKGHQITDVNPQMKDIAWSSGTRLIDYRSDKGDKLQGALYLPANYQPGKKYPLLVTIYERRSQNMRSFVSPARRAHRILPSTRAAATPCSIRTSCIA